MTFPVAGKRTTRRSLVLICLVTVPSGVTAAGPDSFESGFSHVDITPEVPLRLSGYATRTAPLDRVGMPIYVRAMAFEIEGNET